ncbi:MAG: hypothetical protein WBH44_00455 [Proteocatella sp.]
MENELRVRSLRIDEMTFEKFKSIANQEFGNQGQCLSALVNLYETEKGKLVIVDRKMEIESFQMHANKLNELFLSSLSINQDTEERVKSSFEKLLSSKDNIIADLQERLKAAVASLAELENNSSGNRAKFSEKESRIKELENLIDEKMNKYDEIIKDKNFLNETLSEASKEKSNLIDSLSNDINNFKDEIEKLRALETENICIKKELEELRIKATSLSDEIEKQKNKFEFEKERMSLDLERNNQAVISKLNEVHNTDMKEYMNKLEDANAKYNEYFTNQNEKMHILSSENNDLKFENEKLKFELEKYQNQEKK